jgi:predicted Rossmann fold flavoprotein
MVPEKTVVVIGGGAAGFFAAINVALRHPEFRIIILEKSAKLLSKVRISGGGRCNVTHDCRDNALLAANYPRGSRELRQAFSRFSVADTIEWFNNQGVILKTEEDGRMFPISDDSETIVSCFLGLAKKTGIEIRISTEVHAIRPADHCFEVKTSTGLIDADFVICASGGHPKAGNYSFLERLGIKIDPPVPSLFTFNLPGASIRKLQGLSVSQAEVRVSASRYKSTGPLLITHWGLSGPAVLKLSAFSAQELHDCGYKTSVTVNWIYPQSKEPAMALLQQCQKERPRMQIDNFNPFSLPKRLWEHFLAEAGIDPGKKYAETAKKDLLALCSLLCAGEFAMEGKTTFKEEFVTCGGVNLKEVDFRTMACRRIPGLYFCGEVLNIDGVTGGFNFQSAWTTAWICANSID